MQIQIIIPVFNEAAPLARLLPSIPSRLIGHPTSILVVSDGSTDETVSVAIGHPAEVLALAANQGKGAAVAAGLRHTHGSADIVVLMDGDGQHSPEDLGRLLKPLLDRSADIVVGSRYIGTSKRGTTPMNRYFVRWLTVRLLGSLLNRNYTDPYCGFRAFSRRALESVEFEGSRYEGELEILFDAARAGLRVVEVSIEKVYGPNTSKMSADGGRVLGRLRVIGQYGRTIFRNARQISSPAPSLEPRPLEVRR